MTTQASSQPATGTTVTIAVANKTAKPCSLFLKSSSGSEFVWSMPEGHASLEGLTENGRNLFKELGALRGVTRIVYMRGTNQVSVTISGDTEQQIISRITMKIRKVFGYRAQLAVIKS